MPQNSIQNFMDKPFSAQQEEQIIDAIRKAEAQTSGEIRVHIESKCTENVLDRAAIVFRQLNMQATEQHNGVLIYLAIDDRKFAIIGDKGINNVVPADFWNSTKDLMQDHFKKHQLTEGLIAGINMAGEQLKKFFPFNSNDSNELSNDVSFGQ